ncbi:MAG TPA: galactosamine-6-phosphate isomerase [Puia sp.]|nr:galactosamine-6-phosphate isomerase [Puia sp.]
MDYFIVDTYEDMSKRAAEIVLGQLNDFPRLLLGAATGNSPTGLYARLADAARQTPAAFDSLRIAKLDEWLGLPMDHPGSCEAYIRAHLLKPLNIAADRYFTFESDPADPEAECRKITRTLETQGPLDICILGIGTNGHIAFNEPAPALTPHAHVAALAKSSQSHSMVAGSGKHLVSGLTVGMADIFNSRQIILLISGTSKREIVRKLMTKEITTGNPASLLWLHPNAICLIDRAAAE